MVGSPPGILSLGDHFDLTINQRAALEGSPDDEPTMTAARSFPICDGHSPTVSRIMLEVGAEYQIWPAGEPDVPRLFGRQDEESQSERTAATFSVVRRYWQRNKESPRRIRLLGMMVVDGRHWLRAEDAGQEEG